LTPIDRFAGLLYRALNPVYARDPLSGRGAQVYGGRFNPKGTPALYASLSPVTALREANQVGALQPTTLVAYEADVRPVFDTRDAEALAGFGMTPEDLASAAWRDDMIATGESGRRRSRDASSPPATPRSSSHLSRGAPRPPTSISCSGAGATPRRPGSFSSMMRTVSLERCGYSGLSADGKLWNAKRGSAPELRRFHRGLRCQKGRLRSDASAWALIYINTRALRRASMALSEWSPGPKAFIEGGRGSL